jgi:hypothetical protein
MPISTVEPAKPSQAELEAELARVEAEQAEREKAKAEADEKALWNAVSHSDTIAEYEYFLKFYPSGRFSQQAKEAIEKIEESDKKGPSKTSFGVLTKVEIVGELVFNPFFGDTTRLTLQNPDNAIAILYFDRYIDGFEFLSVDSFTAEDYRLVTKRGISHRCLGMMEPSAPGLVSAYMKENVSVRGHTVITTQLAFEVPKHAGLCELTFAGKIVGTVKIP